MAGDRYHELCLKSEEDGIKAKHYIIGFPDDSEANDDPNNHHLIRIVI